MSSSNLVKLELYPVKAKGIAIARFGLEKAEKGHEGIWLWGETSAETIREIRDALDGIPGELSSQITISTRSFPVRA